MKTLTRMMFVKFLSLLGIGVYVAFQNAGPDGMFIEPFLTKVAVCLTVVGLFGMMGCAVVLDSLKLKEKYGV